MTLPRDISAEGYRIDDLLVSTNYLVAAVAVVAISALIIVLVRDRERADHSAAAWRGSGPRRWWIPAAVALFMFAVIDGNLFVRSTMSMHGPLSASGEASADAIRIEVNAQQWAWNIRYPGADGHFATKDDVITLGEMRVPLGAEVRIELAASDVVHALSIPSVRIKADAIPGRIARLRFSPRALGEFDIVCAQFCGTYHYRMQGRLIVMAPADFEAWAAQSSRDSKRIVGEDERAVDEEPSREPLTDGFPVFAPDPMGRERSWGWPWGSAETVRRQHKGAGR